MKAELKLIYANYDSFCEKRILNRRITHSELINILDNIPGDIIKQKVIGYSVEDREIRSLEFGEGEVNVLMWSQMHGDEPTATSALLDLVNFISFQNPFEEIKKDILSNLRVTIVPMLNPDGCERMRRVNALGIDINRDAKQLVSPESQILHNLLINIKPDFAFNLHDQDIRWSVGNTNYPASISLLAPPPDYNNTIDESRKRAINLISQLFNQLSGIIPNRIARYSNEHEPRSFGDFAASVGSSTILVESGREAGDEDKQNLRRLNAALFIYSLHSIANKEYELFEDEIYNSIPFNGKLYHDLILRNVSISINERESFVDIGIDRNYEYDEKFGSEFTKGVIKAIGDLSNTFGLEEFDAKGMKLKNPEIFLTKEPRKEFNLNELWDFIEKWQLYILTDKKEKEFTDLPINFSLSDSLPFNLLPDEDATFIISGEDLQTVAVINGYLVKSRDDLHKVRNGIIKSP